MACVEAETSCFNGSASEEKLLCIREVTLDTHD